MTRRRILHVVAYLLLLTVTVFLTVEYVQSRRSHAELQEKLDSSKQESDRIRSELTLLQEKFDELRAVQELVTPDPEQDEIEELRSEINALQQQLKEKDEAHSALLAQVQSTQQALEQARKTQSAALAESGTTQKQGEGIVSAIQKAARQQREAEELSRKMKEDFFRPLSTVRKRAEESTDPEERERLFRVADIVERARDSLDITSIPLDEEQRKKRDQERDELGSEFRALAREHVQAELQRIRVRFDIPSEQAEEFERAALRVIGDPMRGGSSLLSVRYSIFFPPEDPLLSP